MVVDRQLCFLGFLNCTVGRCFDISEEHTVSIFWVTPLFCVDAEVIWKMNSVSYIG